MDWTNIQIEGCFSGGNVLDAGYQLFWGLLCDASRPLVFCSFYEENILSQMLFLSGFWSKAVVTWIYWWLSFCSFLHFFSNFPFIYWNANANSTSFSSPFLHIWNQLKDYEIRFEIFKLLIPCKSAICCGIPVDFIGIYGQFSFLMVMLNKEN